MGDDKLALHPCNDSFQEEQGGLKDDSSCWNLKSKHKTTVVVSTGPKSLISQGPCPIGQFPQKECGRFSHSNAHDCSCRRLGNEQSCRVSSALENLFQMQTVWLPLPLKGGITALSWPHKWLPWCGLTAPTWDRTGINLAMASQSLSHPGSGSRTFCGL